MSGAVVSAAATATHRATGRGSLAGTGALVRLALRRDRIMLPVWVLALTGITAAIEPSLREAYPTAQSRLEFAASLGSNPTLAALYGRPFDLSTLGGLLAWRILVFAAVGAAMMSMFLVTRHTRAEEETGRLELLGACVVGRRAPLTAALVVAVGANLALALLVSLALAGSGEPAGGAVALGLALGGTGCVFAAVAAVAAQLTEGARAANGIVGTVLGLSFLLRAVGDATDADSAPAALSWLSPIGWAEQVRPYAAERWWVFGVLAAAAAVLTGAAYALVAGRDVGAGLVPTRPGPATGAPRLRSPLALAWRLHRGTLAAWAGSFAVLGGVLGSIAAGIGDLFGDNPQLRDYLTRLGGTQGLIDAYLAAEMGIVGLIAAVYAVQATLRLRAEETGMRAEPVLATAVGRIRWAASHLVFAALGTAVLLAVAGLTAGLAHGLRIGDVGGQVPRLLGAALISLPAAWVVVGLAVALYGLVPRLTTLGWAVASGCAVLGLYGPILQLDQAVLDVSPFTHVPKIPGAAVTAAPLLWLAGIALALTAAGLVAFRRRDIG